MSENKEQMPLIIKILGWYGIIFGCCYIIYGVISIVLGMLDRNYTTVGTDFVLIFYGVPLLIMALGFKNYQRWGWIGYTALLMLIVIYAFASHVDSNGIIIGVISLLALVGMMYPGVRKRYFPT